MSGKKQQVENIQLKKSGKRSKAEIIEIVKSIKKEMKDIDSSISPETNVRVL